MTVAGDTALLAPLRPLVPRRRDELPTVHACRESAPPALAPLHWARWNGLASRPPKGQPAPIPTIAGAPVPLSQFRNLTEFAASLQRSSLAVANAHSQFLQNQGDALNQIEVISKLLSSTAHHLVGETSDIDAAS